MFLWTLLAITCALGSNAVPLMPKKFRMKFNETVKGGGRTDGPFPGEWIYDWDSRRWVIVHSDSRISEFCWRNDPLNQKCTLQFFTADSRARMAVEFGNGTCCELCGSEDGCSILYPDWLQRVGAEKKEMAIIGGRSCQGYGAPGAVTTIDEMYFDVTNGDICKYHEIIAVQDYRFDHNMTFALPVPFDDDSILVPEACKKAPMCPTPWPPRGPQAYIV